MPAYDKKLLIDVRLALHAAKELQKEMNGKVRSSQKLDSKNLDGPYSKLQQLSALNLRLLEETHEKYGNQKVLRECYHLFHDAKCALTNWTNNSPPAAAKFLEAVRLIEQRPIWETIHDEKVQRKIKSAWQRFCAAKDDPAGWSQFLEKFSGHLHHHENYPNSESNFFLLPVKKAEEKVMEFFNSKSSSYDKMF